MLTVQLFSITVSRAALPAMNDAGKRKSFFDDLEHWATEQPDEPWLAEHWTSHQTSISWAEGAAQLKFAAAETCCGPTPTPLNPGPGGVYTPEVLFQMKAAIARLRMVQSNSQFYCPGHPTETTRRR